MPIASVGKIILLHHSHEGSHAMCQSFESFCLEPDCTERFDAGKHEGRIDWDGALSESMVLLRLRERDTEELLERLGPDDVVLCLVRTDLMRWTVSEYFKVNPSEATANPYLAKNPQFLHHWQGINVTVTPEYYKLDLVRSTAKALVARWREKVKILNRVQRSGTRYGILTYEEFLEAGTDYLAAALQAFRLETPCTNHSATITSERVHSDNIADSVLNYADIYHLFRYADFPTWGALAQRHQDADV